MTDRNDDGIKSDSASQGDIKDKFVRALSDAKSHMSSQSHIPVSLRGAILQAEANCRTNGGEVMEIATIDGKEAVRVPLGIQKERLLSFLLDSLQQKGAESIQFAFAGDDDRLCVIYMDRTEAYVANSSIKRQDTEVTLGDWDIQQLHNR
jgi:hypothetical protein